MCVPSLIRAVFYEHRGLRLHPPGPDVQPQGIVQGQALQDLLHSGGRLQAQLLCALPPASSMTPGCFKTGESELAWSGQARVQEHQHA